MHRIFEKFSILLFKLYLVGKSMKKFTVTDEKIFDVYKAFDH